MKAVKSRTQNREITRSKDKRNENQGTGETRSGSKRKVGRCREEKIRVGGKNKRQEIRVKAKQQEVPHPSKCLQTPFVGLEHNRENVSLDRE